MPFNRCKNCGKLYSDEHKECPRCLPLPIRNERQGQYQDQHQNRQQYQFHFQQQQYQDPNQFQNQRKNNLGCIIASGCGGLSLGAIIAVVVVIFLIGSFFLGVLEFFFELITSIWGG